MITISIVFGLFFLLKWIEAATIQFPRTADCLWKGQPGLLTGNFGNGTEEALSSNINQFQSFEQGFINKNNRALSTRVFLYLPDTTDYLISEERSLLDSKIPEKGPLFFESIKKPLIYSRVKTMFQERLPDCQVEDIETQVANFLKELQAQEESSEDATKDRLEGPLNILSVHQRNEALFIVFKTHPEKDYTLLILKESESKESLSLLSRTKIQTPQDFKPSFSSLSPTGNLLVVFFKSQKDQSSIIQSYVLEGYTISNPESPSLQRLPFEAIACTFDNINLFVAFADFSIESFSQVELQKKESVLVDSDNDLRAQELEMTSVLDLEQPLEEENKLFEESRGSDDRLKVSRTGFKRSRGRVLAPSGCSVYIAGCVLCDPVQTDQCTDCGAEWYLNTATATCVHCTTLHAECGKCTATECTKCLGHWTQDPGDISKCRCLVTAWLDGSVCKPCFRGCKECTSGTDCSLCRSGWTLGTNPDSSNSCTPCQPNCWTCASTTDCSVCDDYFVVNGTSPTRNCKECDPGYFWKYDKACHACSSQCATCKYAGDYCLSCPTSLTHIPETKKCIRTDCTGATFYNNVTDTCDNCASTCSKCLITTSHTDCYECSGLLFKERYTTIGYCVTNKACGTGFYLAHSGGCNTYPAVYTGSIKYSRFSYRATSLPYSYSSQDASGKALSCYGSCATCKDYDHDYCFKCPAGKAKLEHSRLDYPMCIDSNFYSGYATISGSRYGPNYAPRIWYQSADLVNGSSSAASCDYGGVLLGDSTCGYNCFPAFFEFVGSGSKCFMNANYFKWCEDNRDELNEPTNRQCTVCSPSSYQGSYDYCYMCHPGCQDCVSASVCTVCHPGYHMTFMGSCELKCATGEYWDVSLEVCKPALPKCRTASVGPEDCTSCPPGEELVTNTCQKVCPVDKYLDATTKTCLPCDSSCLSCTGPGSSDCISCPFGKKLSARPGSCGDYVCHADAECTSCWGPQLHQCSEVVPGKYLNFENHATFYPPHCNSNEYFDFAADQCQTCHAACLHCTGPTASNCSRCSLGYFRLHDTCYSNPNNCNIYNGQFIDADNSEACVSCSDSNCLQCYPASECKICKSGFFPDKTTGLCVACPANTIYCQQNGGLSLACETGYFFGHGATNCTRLCNYNQYWTASATCTDCSDNCRSCVASTTRCDSCYPGDYRFNGGSNCSVNKNVALKGYYGAAKTKCPLGCDTCNDATTCLSCAPGYFLDGSACTRCDPKCHTCQGTGTHCLTCMMGYDFDAINNRCVPFCTENEYYDAANNVCLLCPPNCLTCDATGAQCLTCFDNMYLDSGTCKFCPDGCKECTSNSAGDTSPCTSCLYDWKLNTANGLCERECSPGSYLNESMHECIKCHKFCIECVGPTAYNCTKCRTDFTFEANTATDYSVPVPTGFCKRTCTQTNQFYKGPFPNECTMCYHSCKSCFGPGKKACKDCNPGFYQIENTCFKCHPFCKECTGPSSFDCTSCETGYNLIDGFCKDTSCAAGTAQYYDTRACVNCHANCLTCFNLTDSSCASCDPANLPLLLANHTCIGSCGHHKFYNSTARSCDECHADCKECNGPMNTNCTECWNTGEYVQLNGTCDTGCHPRSFISTDPHICAACGTNCWTCTGTANTQCSTCLLGSPYNLQPDSSCLQNCPTSYYPDASQVCQPCFANCLNCVGPGVKECTECPLGRKLRPDNLCAKWCSIGYYYNEITDNCEKCDVNCLSCTGPEHQDCIKCTLNRYFHPTILCVENCPDRTFPQNDQCVVCSSACQTCSGPSSDNCTSCVGSMVLRLDGTCDDNCPQYQFIDSQGRCQKCFEKCATCKGLGEYDCLTCIKPNEIFLSSNGACIDCTSEFAKDPDLCWFSVPLQLKQAQGNMKSSFASNTLILTFQNQEKFISRLSPALLKESLALKIDDIPDGKYTYEYRIEGGHIFIDLKFSNSFGPDQRVVVSPKQPVILRNKDTNATELIFQRGEYESRSNAEKAPNEKLFKKMHSMITTSSKLSEKISWLGIVLSFVTLFMSTGMAGIFMRFFKVFKIMSRLRLINIYFGLYLEMFLSFLNVVFSLGNNPITKETLEMAPFTRGKLTKYKISVLSASILPIPYTVYYLSLVCRIYRNKIKPYASKSQLNFVDNLICSIAELSRCLLLVVVGVDLFFYSLHCVSHIRVAEVSLTQTAFISYILSAVTVIVIPIDFLFLVIENAGTNFEAIEKQQKIVQMVMAKNKTKGCLCCKKKVPPPILSESKTNSIKPTRKTSSNSMRVSNIGSMNELSGAKKPLEQDSPLQKKPSLDIESETPTPSRKLFSKNSNYQLSTGDKGNNASKLQESNLLSPLAQKRKIALKRAISNQKNTFKSGLKLMPVPLKIRADLNKCQTIGALLEKKKEIETEPLFMIENEETERFFVGGLKMDKVKTTWIGRYFNMLMLLKLFLFEPCFIGLQMLQRTQIAVMTFVQLVTALLVLLAGFKYKIFKSKLSYFMIFFTEWGLLSFMCIGMAFESRGVDSFKEKTRNGLQFFSIAIIMVACFMTLIDVILRICKLPGSIVQQRKVNKYLKEEEAKRKDEELVIISRLEKVPGLGPDRIVKIGLKESDETPLLENNQKMDQENDGEKKIGQEVSEDKPVIFTRKRKRKATTNRVLLK